MKLLKLFRIFHKKRTPKNSDNGVLGPEYLEAYTEPVPNPRNLDQFEWRRKLVTKSKKFKIRYYGQLREDFLISETEEAPPKVIAIAEDSGEELLLFDGCRHGYHALLCEKFSEEVKGRKADKFYRDKKENEVFELIVSAYYQIDYEGVYREKTDEKGDIELIDGEKISFELLKRNGFNFFQLLGFNEKGQRVEILSEELA